MKIWLSNEEPDIIDENIIWVKNSWDALKVINDYNSQIAEDVRCPFDTYSISDAMNFPYLECICLDCIPESMKLLERLLEMKEELKDLNVDDRTQFNESLLTALEVINMVEICILIVKSAILRRESRGAHFREDFPETNDEIWKKSIVMGPSKIRFAKR